MYSYFTSTILELTTKLGSLKELVAAHKKLVHYYIVLPTNITITDANLFEITNSVSPGNNIDKQPPFFHEVNARALLSRAKSQSIELEAWAELHLIKLNDHNDEFVNKPSHSGPYVNIREMELLNMVRKYLEEMLALFEKVRHYEELRLRLRAKLQVEVYLNGSLDDVLKLVPVLLQFGKDE
jgi:hypothetical protein